MQNSKKETINTLENTLEHIIKNYKETHNRLRFGQDLWNKMAENGLWDAPEANALFYIEDEDLIKILVPSRQTKPKK